MNIYITAENYYRNVIIKIRKKRTRIQEKNSRKMQKGVQERYLKTTIREQVQNIFQ